MQSTILIPQLQHNDGKKFSDYFVGSFVLLTNFRYAVSYTVWNVKLNLQSLSESYFLSKLFSLYMLHISNIPSIDAFLWFLSVSPIN